MMAVNLNLILITLILVNMILMHLFLVQDESFSNLESNDERMHGVTKPKKGRRITPFQSKIETTRPIKCTPVNDRLHPMCEEEFQEIKKNWKDRCFKDHHKIDGTDCSILSYLQEVEPFCQKSNDVKHNNAIAKAEFRSNMEELLSVLSHQDLSWLRKRVVTLWPSWVEAINELVKDKQITNRNKKKILFYPTALAEQRWILKLAGKGAFLGEIVQWTDTITSAYILGHDITVLLERDNVTRVLQRDDHGCAAKASEDFPNFDLIFTDCFGFAFMRSYLLGYRTTSKYRCKIRVLDSFGTEAKYNYKRYHNKPIDGGNPWGEHNLLLPQFFTYFPHSPDNTFLGVAVANGKYKQTVPKKDIGVIYGKQNGYLKGKLHYINIIKEYFEIHATMGSNNSLPSHVKNHGVLSYKELTELLSTAKLFIGLGFPFEGPGPIEAVAYGAVFLNPKFTTPKSKFNDNFFGGKPNERKITSQNQYLEDFVGEPYVHTIDINDENQLRATLKKIKEYKTFDAHLPREFSNVGMLERLGKLIQHQDFCDVNAPRWPPIHSFYKFIGKTGRSCKDECHARGLICEPSFFTDINSRETFKRFGINCKSTIVIKDLKAPFYRPSNGTCYIQENFMYFSCVSENTSSRRLCPCRTYNTEQTAICDGC